MISIRFPGITDEQFEDAFRVLEECIAPPSHGFVHPFMGPGGQYGNCWWERDTSLTLNAWCWKDQRFCEKVLENFAGIQKDNGRIPLWGNDRVGEYDEQLSAIPVIFDVARRICRRTTDRAFIEKIFQMLARYLGWWLSPIKRDGRTGLVCAIFEESDPCNYAEQLTYAPVDLNVQVAVGADNCAELAAYLGKDPEPYRRIFREQRDIINRWLYDEETGGYYTRQVREDRLMTERPYNSMFDTFRRHIVPDGRIPRLLAILKDNTKYGYGRPYGLTTVPFDSPEFRETTGPYQGWVSWCGNVWTLRNEIICKGLRESGLDEESAHIALQTVRTFNGKYTEFVNPSTGEGHGVLRYGWTASEYIELLAEELFGIDWCAWDDCVTVAPNLPKELQGETVSLSGLLLGDGSSLDVTVTDGGAVRVKRSKAPADGEITV